MKLLVVFKRFQPYILAGLVIIVGLIIWRIRVVQIAHEGNNVPTLPNTQSANFITSLPHTTADYTLQLVPNTGTTTLLIIPNITVNGLSPAQDQINAQWDNYVKDSKEAIDYIKAQAGGIADYNITFWFQEFWPAGKTIDPATL